MRQSKPVNTTANWYKTELAWSYNQAPIMLALHSG